MKKIKTVALLTAYLFLLSGCKQESNNSNTTTAKVVSFNVGFNVTKRFSGVYYDSIKKEEFIYFADPTTAKKMKFFELAKR